MANDVLAGRKVTAPVDVKSQYFLVRTDVIVGQAQVHLQSVLLRDKGKTRALYRVRTPVPLQPGPEDLKADSTND